MKKIILLLNIALATITNSFGQSIISPIESSEFCPLVNTTFTVTIPLIKAGTGVTLTAIGTPTIVTGVTGLTSSGANTTFTFVGRFSDDNNTQSFRIDFTRSNNTPDFKIFEFKKIKSLKFYSTPSAINPSLSSINSPRCLINTHNISFSNIQFGNGFDASVGGYGSVTAYEFLLPSGWKLGAITSDGSTWLTSNNNVTITSDLSNGNGGSIQIRGINSCNSSLAKSPPKVISITRSRPTMTITGIRTICSGSPNSFSVNGLPPNATVCWSLSSNGSATIPSNPFCSNTVTLGYSSVGTTNLTATVTDCIETYALPAIQIVTGIPSVDRFNVQGNRFDYGANGPNRIYTVCPSENLTIYPNVQVDPSNILEHSWEYVSGTYNLFSGGNYFGAYVNTASGVGATLGLRYRYRNACGWSNYDYVNFTNMNCDGGEEPYKTVNGNINFTISPNPANDFVILTTTNIKEQFIITLLDAVTSRQILTQRINSGITKVRLSTSNLKAGSYIIRVTSNGKIKTNLLRIVK